MLCYTAEACSRRNPEWEKGLDPNGETEARQPPLQCFVIVQYCT